MSERIELWHMNSLVNYRSILYMLSSHGSRHVLCRLILLHHFMLQDSTKSCSSQSSCWAASATVLICCAGWNLPRPSQKSIMRGACDNSKLSFRSPRSHWHETVLGFSLHICCCFTPAALDHLPLNAVYLIFFDPETFPVRLPSGIMS